jgi:hypothetical protein
MKEVIEQAGAEYQKMIAEQSEWIKEEDIPRYIRSAPWNAGAFIRKEFGFNAFFKKGREYFYSRKDMIALGEELDKRNINLKRYKELLEDKLLFEKKTRSQKKFKNKTFRLPQDLKDIQAIDIKKPPVDLILRDLGRLRQEFTIGGLEFYIDIYKGNHAMPRQIRQFEKYLEPGLRRRCRKWCDEFNYANHALELVAARKNPQTG